MVQVDLLDRIVEFLKLFYVDVSAETYKNCVAIYVASGGIFVVILKPGFPYSPPEIGYYGDRDFRYQPHLFSGGRTWTSICCYDPNDVHINPDEPERMVKEYLDRAKKIVKEKRTNYQTAKQDFEEEISSYISKISIRKRVISFLPPRTDSLLCELHFGNNNTVVILEEGERNRFCSKMDSVLSVPIVFLEASDIINSSRTIRAIYKKLLGQGYEHKILVSSFVQSLSLGHLIILPFRVGEALNSSFVLICRIPKKVRIRNIEFEEILNRLGERTFKLTKCTCLNQDYLFSRGGLGSEFRRNQRVLIIGCGSFGSVVARMFVESGVTDMKLIDPDVLEAGNIARHVCGVNDIDRPKVLALKEELLKHNPNLKIECINKTVQSLSMDHLKKYLFNVDLVISCTGDYPTERYIVDVLQDMDKQLPIVLLWGEPYLIATHGILVQKRQDDLKSLLYQYLGLNQKSVVANPKDLTKIEFGCGSSYVPYSGFSVNQSIYSIMGQILNSTLNNDGNYLLSWYNSVAYYQQFSGLGITLNCELGRFPELKETRLD